ncbi:MAG: hypothetical protein ACJAT2_001509 [Bacteriovoracaceae bacterium]|jgi:hypothetical protein
MVIRNCKKLLADLHELEEKMEHLSRSYPDLDPDFLLELILKTEG